MTTTNVSCSLAPPLAKRRSQGKAGRGKKSIKPRQNEQLASTIDTCEYVHRQGTLTETRQRLSLARKERKKET